MKHETAGDPITGLKWTRRALKKIAKELAKADIHVNARTVGRILVKMGFTLKTCRKNIEAGKRKPGHRKRRDQQFKNIFRLRDKFERAGLPVISIDSKKKEKIGNFKNDGKALRRDARETLDHDYPSDAKGKGIPYTIYDLQKNKALAVVGTSSETPEFATDALETWWLMHGRRDYKNAKHIMIMADCGGGNGYRSTVWKRDLQTKLCNRYGLTISINHFPPGASKWNPIEHRVFSEISKNWAGEPLESYETMLNYISTTTTESGLKVKAVLNEKIYEKGKKASVQELQNLNITWNKKIPEWNYTISPHKI